MCARALVRVRDGTCFNVFTRCVFAVFVLCVCTQDFFLEPGKTGALCFDCKYREGYNKKNKKKQKNRGVMLLTVYIEKATIIILVP